LNNIVCIYFDISNLGVEVTFGTVGSNLGEFHQIDPDGTIFFEKLCMRQSVLKAMDFSRAIRATNFRGLATLFRHVDPAEQLPVALGCGRGDELPVLFLG